MLGMIFDLDKSNVMRGIKYLEPAVKCSIPIPTKKYADSKKLKTIQELQQFFPELIAITDGTEQQIPRPKDKRTKSQKQNVYQKIEKEKWVQDTSFVYHSIKIYRNLILHCVFFLFA